MQITSSGFLIRNIDGLYLCGKPSNNPFYTIPKGQLNVDESIIDAAYRETLEESGLDLRSIKGSVRYIGSVNYKIKKDTKVLHVYLFESQEDLNKYEHKCTTYYVDKNGIEKPELETYKYVDYDTLCLMVYKSLSVFLNSYKNVIVDAK